MLMDVVGIWVGVSGYLMGECLGGVGVSGCLDMRSQLPSNDSRG